MIASRPRSITEWRAGALLTVPDSVADGPAELCYRSLRVEKDKATMGMGVFFLRRAIMCSLLAAVALVGALAPLPASAQGGPAAWRVECTGDGKTLECRAIQLIVRDRQLLMQVA